MSANQQRVSARGMIVLLMSLINIIVLRSAYLSGGKGYWVLLITLPLLLFVLYNIKQRKHA